MDLGSILMFEFVNKPAMKKDKYLQIFNYLLEFSKLRSIPVRNLDQYDDKLWFADIPQCEIFDCITFPNYNQDADYWLKINKPKEEPKPPTFAKLSDTLSDWIIEESLIDENGIATLKESIIRGDETLLLSDNPQVVNELQDYINNKWIDDLELYKIEFANYGNKLAEYKKQNQTYKHLFIIYNKAQQFGEEYELVVGVGLLNFQEDAKTPLICRHILTSKAEISFEFSHKESFVKVSPSTENEIQIETDAIIDLPDQFDSADIIEAEKKVAEFLKEKNILDNPFDDNIKDAIQIFADRLRTDGQSKDDLTKPGEIPKKPTVYSAPALLLRKRNTRSFTFYAGILGAIGGVMVSDFFIVRKKTLDINQLYRIDSTYGKWNKKALFSLVCGIAIASIGWFIPADSNTSLVAIAKIMKDASWFAGFIASFLLYWLSMKKHFSKING